MLFESEDVIDCVDKKGRCTDFKSLMEDQVSSVVSVSPTALFRTPQHAENTRPRMSNYDQWSSESEGERGLNEFQRKMKREHQQALACVHKACIVVERNRRKRVTVSCNKLRQLLPQVSGARSDMVTVLEMTVAFLEYINQATLEHLNRECLFPPDDVCRWWLSETHQKRWLSHRQGCMEQKTTCHFRSRKNSSPLNAVHREKLSGRAIPKGPLSTPRMLSTILRPHAPPKYYTPSFWYSPTQSPVTSGNPLQITMDCSSETGSKDKLLSSKPTSMSKWFRNAEQE